MDNIRRVDIFSRSLLDLFARFVFIIVSNNFSCNIQKKKGENTKNFPKVKSRIKCIFFSPKRDISLARVKIIYRPKRCALCPYKIKYCVSIPYT